jgi:cation diffusion facilitator CzcD-associated flavoprotein CzcO
MGNDINGQVEIDTIVIGSGIGGMAAAHDLA